MTREEYNLIESRFQEYKTAFVNSDWSLATFPRTGEAAFIEILTKIETLQWVLEMCTVEGE